jgi:hypothetical protein
MSNRNNTAVLVEGEELVTDEQAVKTTEVEVTHVSPYKAAGIVNGWLEEDGHDRKLPPQMFYNYTTGQIKKGRKPLIEIDSDNKISLEVLTAWYEKYVAKNITAKVKAEPTDEEVEEEVTESE